MTGASKILTVSYGTFSCTLEGFDNPFNTMKAIAEYFRDLTSDDRYFGAEPPQPDPTTLHQIAEREVQRRVDAKFQENGLVLKAGPQPAAVPAPRGQDRPHAEKTEQKADRAAQAERPRPADPAANPSRSDAAADVAHQRLQRLRRMEQQQAKAAASAPPPVAPQPASTAEQFISDGEDELLLPRREMMRSPAPQVLARPTPAIRPEANDTPRRPEAAAESLSPVRAKVRVRRLTPTSPQIVAIRPQSGFADEDGHLPPELEAELAAELAAVTGLPDPAAMAVPDDLAADQDMSSSSEQSGFPTSGDASLTRLMAEADTQMDDGNIRRRQAALAHMKAAVAATRAERQSGMAVDINSRMGAYRSDLNTLADGDASERPSPLVLVSSLRVDRPLPPEFTGGAAIDESDADVEDEGVDFAPQEDPSEDNSAGDDFVKAPADADLRRFVGELGAKQLPDLLQAAAVYMAVVEGRDSFTRPQLMRYVAGLTEAMPREDGLRAFGTLLREGVFERAKRGQFALTATSSMLIEAKRLAG